MTDLQKSPWPEWETVQLIGRGSFGVVYEIRRELVDGTTESAAMKVITIPQNQEDISEMYGEGYDDESITATFRAHLKSIVAEYSLMRKLDGSANTVSCKDISYIQHSDGLGWDIFIRMELLTPLMKTLPGTMPEETVLKIGRDICSALVLCKKYDIVHRDIKPQNIFVSPNGDYKLGDFGIAKTVEKTMGGTKVGTYKYMAPEVYNNRPYGSGADIYSLGLVLYWLLNDRRMPFMPLPPAKVLAGQDEEARQRRLSGEPLPPPAHGSAELKAIVLKACAYAPEERFYSAEEMYEALCRCSRIPVSATVEQQPAPQQEASECSLLTPPPAISKPAAVDIPAESNSVPSVRANAPKKTQQIPTQQGHMQKKEESGKKPRRKRSAVDRVITAAIIGIVLLGCCGIVIFGYLNCWFGHTWQAADCTTAKICTRCSTVAEEPLGHLWEEATCTTPKTCTRCGATEGEALGHSWKTATCTSPKTCTRCGATEGEALGHSWEAATCTSPKTCTRCGTTEGEALGHSWKAATCTFSKNCVRCGATEGKSLGHNWKEATYDAPKTCSVCGLTTGTKLELPIYGLDMTLEEFEKQFASLVKEAESWTPETAPQSLNDYPLFPKPLLEMFETIKGAESEIEISGSTLTWKSNLSDVLPTSKTGFETTERFFIYYSSSHSTTEYLQFESGRNDNYTIQLPAEAWTYGSASLLYTGARDWEGLNERLFVGYKVPSKRIDGVSSIELNISNSEGYIVWSGHLDDDNKFKIEIYFYTYANGFERDLSYDMTSGKLLSM